MSMSRTANIKHPGLILCISYSVDFINIQYNCCYTKHTHFKPPFPPVPAACSQSLGAGPILAMRSGSEPPLSPGLGPSAVSGASFGDFSAPLPVSEPLCSASLCPSVCAPPASDPVAVRPSGSCSYCTDPSCPRAPALDS